MSRIAIVIQGLVPGDAVANDALEMQRVLKARGHEVRLFADALHERAQVDVRDCRRIQKLAGFVHLAPLLREDAPLNGAGA